MHHKFFVNIVNWLTSYFCHISKRVSCSLWSTFVMSTSASLKTCSNQTFRSAFCCVITRNKTKSGFQPAFSVSFRYFVGNFNASRPARCKINRFTSRNKTKTDIGCSASSIFCYTQLFILDRLIVHFFRIKIWIAQVDWIFFVYNRFLVLVATSKTFNAPTSHRRHFFKLVFVHLFTDLDCC